MTTDPELVRLVVLELNAGAERIWVGDNPAGVRTISLEDYLKPTGVGEAAGDYFVNPRLEVFNFPLRSRFVSAVPVSSLLREADVILISQCLRPMGSQ